MGCKVKARKKEWRVAVVPWAASHWPKAAMAGDPLSEMANPIHVDLTDVSVTSLEALAGEWGLPLQSRRHAVGNAQVNQWTRSGSLVSFSNVGVLVHGGVCTTQRHGWDNGPGGRRTRPRKRQERQRWKRRRPLDRSWLLRVVSCKVCDLVAADVGQADPRHHGQVQSSAEGGGEHLQDSWHVTV